MVNPSIATSTWSRRQWIATIVTALTVFLVFARVGRGDDYFGCYTWMVMTPERLAEVVDFPWTFNPPWLVPFMAPFVTLPGRPGYIVFIAATIVMLLYSTYKLGGKPVLLLLSAHAMWILYWGQIDGWGVIALVIGLYAMQRKSWPLMFLALTLASFKPQISAIPLVALWWWSGPARWKSAMAMVGLLIFSIWVWGPWPWWYWQAITNFVGARHYGPWNASLGLIALPLFIPALLLPMERNTRLLAITATALTVFPYMPYYSTIVLMTFAIPWWVYLFGLLGYLPSLIGTRLAWNAIALMPVSVLIWLYIPYLRAWWQQRSALQPNEPRENQ